MLTLSEALTLARQHHEAGQLAQAENLYLQIVQAEPAQAEAWHLLGRLYQAAGRADQAAHCYQQVLALGVRHAETCNYLGIALATQAKPAEAATAFLQAIQLRSDYAEAHNNLGVTHAALGKFLEAAACFRDALRYKPDYPDALNNLGHALTMLRQPEEAARHLEEALRLRPDYPEALNNLGTAYRALDRDEEALSCYQQALRLRPHYAEVYHNLGSAYRALRRVEECLACYRQAVRLRARDVDLHNHLGWMLENHGHLDESIEVYRQALQLRSDDAVTHNNLGSALMAKGRLREALACFERAIALQPSYADPHFNRAMAWILSGDFVRGWQEFEWRRKRPEFPPRRLPRPLWDGSALDGRTILLHTEMGLGDALHFIRYAPLVKERGGTVLLLCPRRMIPILSTCRGLDRLTAEEDPLPEFDVYAPLVSLPRLFSTRLDTVPADIPYLRAERARVEHWREQLSQFPGFRVGIAWHVGHIHPGAYNRAIPLKHFAPLAEVPEVRLISLQKGEGTKQIREVADTFEVIDLGPEFDEGDGAFLDSAAAVMSLDLLIAADTSLVHLAGALGRPVWVVTAYASDWRWVLGRDDTPWYPTVRLFRPTAENGWDEVFARVAEELRQRVARPSPARPVQVETAPGELIDKITVLELKRTRITNADKLRNVLTELAVLEAARDGALEPSLELTRLTDELRAANAALWEVIDAIYACERTGDHGPRFIDLTRSVYRWNEQRAAVKRKINQLLGSRLIEEKGHMIRSG